MSARLDAHRTAVQIADATASVLTQTEQVSTVAIHLPLGLLNRATHLTEAMSI
jgi:hypothetical protein